MASCLIVVDLQKGFINGHTRHLPKLIQAAKNHYDHLIFTQFHNPPDSFFHTLIGWPKMNRASKDFSLAFVPRADAIRIEKPTYSFVDATFLELLDKYKISLIDIAGVDTDVCVTKCAVDLIEAGRVPTVLTKLCASTAGPKSHRAAVTSLRRFIGTRQVIT